MTKITFKKVREAIDKKTFAAIISSLVTFMSLLGVRCRRVDIFQRFSTRIDHFYTEIKRINELGVVGKSFCNIAALLRRTSTYFE